jgi:hypothetical protein
MSFQRHKGSPPSAFGDTHLVLTPKEGKRAESMRLSANHRSATQRVLPSLASRQEVAVTARVSSAAKARSWTAVPNQIATEAGRRKIIQIGQTESRGGATIGHTE